VIVPDNNIILPSDSQYFHKYEFTTSKPFLASLFLKEIISVTPEDFNKKNPIFLIEMCQIDAFYIYMYFQVFPYMHACIRINKWRNFKTDIILRML
jgi:hypothetical protein